MESGNINIKNTADANKAHAFIKEWKCRRLQDQKEFLSEVNNNEYKKMMDALHGKIVKNGIASAS